jgi:hypothetical protein
MDKVALMTWVVAFTAAVCLGSTRIVHRDLLAMLAMSVASLLLVIAWQSHRMKHHAHNRGAAHSAVHATD